MKYVLALSLSASALLLSCSGGRMLCQIPGPGCSQALHLQEQAIQIRLDPAEHHAVFTDSLFFEGSLSFFELNHQLELQSVQLNGKKIKPSKLVRVRTEQTDNPAACDTWFLPESSTNGPNLLVLKYAGQLYQDLEEVRFGHETVAAELQATVSDTGAWLSAGAGWYPLVDADMLSTFRIHLDLPEDWEGISQGKRLRDTRSEGRHTLSWHGELPAESANVLAGPYDVTRETVDGVELAIWLLRQGWEEAESMGPFGPVDREQLLATYQRMNRRYLQMYSERFGAYPFSKFAVVEAFFPAGYGMPSWTALGSQVIRMPYIPYTSLGHEWLHNWWGNGVMVDASEGNWCEGITVYGADYYYKLEEGPEEAQAYRRDLLQSWRSLVREGNDKALVEFRARHDGASRAIGYGKSMMVFHMANRVIGQEAFDRALRRLASENLGKRVSFSTIFDLFEAEGGVDFSRFKEQWLYHPGAPSLLLSDVDWRTDPDGVQRVHGRVTQDTSLSDGFVWELDLPLRITCHNGDVIERKLLMQEAELEFALEVPEPRELSLDPDNDLFRRLDAGEIDASIRLSLADEAPLVVAPDSWLRDTAHLEHLQSFASRLTDSEDLKIRGWSQIDASEVLAAHSLIGINPPELPAGTEYLPFRHNEDSFGVAGIEGRWQEDNLVLALKSKANEQTGALLFFVSSPDNLGYMARKVPHYGKYGYLVFDNEGTNTQKGRLPSGANPLRVRFGALN